MRDGDVLTEEYYKRRMDEKFGNNGASLLSISLAVILSVALLLL